MMEDRILLKDCFTPFKEATDKYPLPERFNFPFYYDPHPLSLLAAKELQEYLETQSEWVHNFGIDPNQKGLVIGKMFGVLVVKNQQNELGYLSAFSGKLAGANHHSRFVPPVFDMLTEDGFFRKEELVINEKTSEIQRLERASDFLASQEKLQQEQFLEKQELAKLKKSIKAGKKNRKIARQKLASVFSAPEFELFKEELRQESLRLQYYLKDFKVYWKNRIARTESKLNTFLEEIAQLKSERAEKSAALQKKLFNQYQFLNQNGESKSLEAIFKETTQLIPPAGAGECAAPKLLQYAFLHQLQPICIAEFWWGQSPKSEIRAQGQFYPACRGKCKPILGHMLQGMDVEENPMLLNPAEGKTFSIVYEDEHLLLVNKPAEFLSVPGKSIDDSVLFRLQLQYPDATGPLLVHRLDMSTSGLLLVAKTKEIHKYLQQQFIRRKVKKRYVAVLDGIVQGDEGIIDLPLRVDLDDRPRQLVCYEHGKKAQTEWKVIHRREGKTRIHFYPITGRTHQLRVHAAHPLGLNIPIVGDDLYGKKADRLHLHAAYLEFVHPHTREVLKIEVSPEF